jgi:hypothetical protein
VECLLLLLLLGFSLQQFFEFRFFFYQRLLPRWWREETATKADKARKNQPTKLVIMAASIRLQKAFTSSQIAVHRGP